MRRTLVTLIISGTILLMPLAALAQMMPGPGPMMDRPMGKGMGPGMMNPQVAIPENLPKPRNEAWLKNLDDILALEKLSKAQYEHDSAQYNTNMPYMMIEPQEEYHIGLITRLFAAYGVKPFGPVPPVRGTDKLEEAYQVAAELEKSLIPRYERLISGAEDETGKKVLDVILGQTRMHYRMFSHAMRMGRGMMGEPR